MKILVVEDGYEYSELLTRFLGERFEFLRAGNGEEAIAALRKEEWDVVLLDLCFDRIPVSELVGDLLSMKERFNGDVALTQQYLARNQGLYILAMMRSQQLYTPVLLSHDYSHEEARWKRLEQKYKPVRYIVDNAGPDLIADTFEMMKVSV